MRDDSVGWLSSTGTELSQPYQLRLFVKNIGSEMLGGGKFDLITVVNFAAEEVLCTESLSYCLYLFPLCFYSEALFGIYMLFDFTEKAFSSVWQMIIFWYI